VRCRAPETKKELIRCATAPSVSGARTVPPPEATPLSPKDSPFGHIIDQIHFHEEQIAYHVHQLAVLKRQLNAQSLSHRLPSEVLGQIFWFALPHSWFNDGAFANYLAVVRVCSFWRDTALGCSFLWTTLPAGSVARTSLLLSLSNGALLDLDIPPHYCTEAVGPEALVELALVIRQADRIHSIRVPVSTSSSKVDRLLRDLTDGKPTHALQTLEIYDSRPGDPLRGGPGPLDISRPPFKHLERVAPNMREFICRGCSMDVTSLAWKQLNSLGLIDVELRATIPQLFGALSNMTSLRTLRLGIISVLSTSARVQTTTLPSLESLHILPRVDQNLANQFVTHIRASRITELRVAKRISVSTEEDLRILGHSSLLSDYTAANVGALNSVYVRVDSFFSESMISARVECTTSLDISPQVQVSDAGMLFFWVRYHLPRGRLSKIEGTTGVHRIMMEIVHSLKPRCLSLELTKASIDYDGAGLFPFTAQHHTIEAVNLALVGHTTVSDFVSRLDSVVPIGILRLSDANLGESTGSDYILRDILKVHLAARAIRGQPIRQLEVRECGYFSEEDCEELMAKGWVTEKAWIIEADHPALDDEFDLDEEDTSASGDSWWTRSSSGDETDSSSDHAS
jgi:hypothetical protein